MPLNDLPVLIAAARTVRSDAAARLEKGKSEKQTHPHTHCRGRGPGSPRQREQTV